MNRVEAKTKNIVLTGANRGIGAATAAMLARHHNLTLTARDDTLLEQVATSAAVHGNKVLHLAGDLTDEGFVQHLIEESVAAHGSVDCLINNAGIGLFKRVDEFTAAEFDLVYRVNMLGTFLTCKYATPHMIRARGGQVINVASVAGLNGFRSGTAYAASKFAMVGFSESLREDLKEFGIAVSILCPGGVATAFGGQDPAAKKASTDYLLEPEDVARTIEYLVGESETANSKLIELKPRRRTERRT